MRDWAVYVRRLRSTKGWTQGDLASELLVDQGTISRWERGKSVPDPELQKVLLSFMSAESASYLRHYIRNTPGVCGLLRKDDLFFCECISIVGARAYGKAPEEMEGGHITDLLCEEAVASMERVLSTPGWLEGDVATIGNTFRRPDGWYYGLMGQHPVHTELVRYQAGPCSRREEAVDVTYYKDLPGVLAG